MNFYKDRDGGLWVGNEEKCVIFINPHLFRMGYEFETLTWPLDEAASQWDLVQEEFFKED